jgi:hypothetical protein
MGFGFLVMEAGVEKRKKKEGLGKEKKLRNSLSESGYEKFRHGV